MTRAELYGLLKDFQGLIGTLVGFSGVCLTLIVNARLAERKRTTEIQHDRATTRTAILSELLVVEEQLREFNDVLDEARKQLSTARPRKFSAESTSRTFRSAIGRIGLLDIDELKQIVKAYSLYEILSERSAIMNERMQSEADPSVAELLFQSYRSDVRDALLEVRSAVELLREAEIRDNLKRELQEKRGFRQWFKP